LFSLSFDKCKEEFDSNINILMIKCQLTNICLYLYTFHLCSTTICTPQMYFNWFLVVNNCRFTYSTLQLALFIFILFKKKNKNNLFILVRVIHYLVQFLFH